MRFFKKTILLVGLFLPLHVFANNAMTNAQLNKLDFQSRLEWYEKQFRHDLHHANKKMIKGGIDLTINYIGGSLRSLEESKINKSNVKKLRKKIKASRRDLKHTLRPVLGIQKAAYRAKLTKKLKLNKYVRSLYSRLHVKESDYLKTTLLLAEKQAQGMNGLFATFSTDHSFYKVYEKACDFYIKDSNGLNLKKSEQEAASTQSQLGTTHRVPADVANDELPLIELAPEDQLDEVSVRPSQTTRIQSQGQTTQTEGNQNQGTQTEGEQHQEETETNHDHESSSSSHSSSNNDSSSSHSESFPYIQ